MSERCSATMRGDGQFGWLHPRQCQREGTIERDGRWYCAQHDPERVAARRAKRDAARRPQLDAQDAARARARRRADLTAALVRAAAEGKSTVEELQQMAKEVEET